MITCLENKVDKRNNYTVILEVEHHNIFDKTISNKENDYD
jgi:hypothetical protein